ncbi:MAG TPA: nucleotide exchange factor GrpE [Saprospiraceae bacterium]|nr:nucleotide exchange factor GrpE [Saprospiraceae bacterium]
MIDQENTSNPAEEIEVEPTPTAPENDDSRTGKKKKKSGKDSEKVHQLEAEIAELKDKYLRLYAEFDNYKKRTVKEKLDLMRTAAQDTLASMLPVLDDFDRAKKIADDPSATEKFSEGVVLVYQKLHAIFKNLGVKEMESTGAEFNPELHDAITEIPAPDEQLKGKVVDTIEKGYYLHDKIIRHAKVVVGR